MTTLSSHVCPRCGAQRLHRSRTRSFLEQLARELTPLRVYRCHSCGLRTWTFGRARSTGKVDQKELGLPARPLESRDREWRRRRLKKILFSVILAGAIGAVTALWLILNPRCAEPPAQRERVSRLMPDGADP